MFSTLVIAASPFITSTLTGLMKRIPAFTSLSDQARTPLVRLLAAFVAVVYVMLGMYVTGSITPDVLSNVVNAFVLALLAWLGSLGIFHAFFQKVVGGVPVQ